MRTTSIDRGFTVIEIVLVLAISATVALVAMVVYQPASVNVQAEADRVRNDLRLMQSAAMAWRVPLRFTPSAGGYAFSCTQTIAGTPCATGTLDGNAARRAGLLNVNFSQGFESGLQFTGGPGTLDYDTHGRLASSCHTTCVISSAAYTATLAGGGNNVLITVDPITGFPR